MAEDRDVRASPEKGDNPVPPITMGETGYNGLNVIGGNILEEYQHELRWPYLIQTIKEMAKDETIAPALSLFETQIAKPEWEVKIPKGYEKELEEKATYLRQTMNDMEHSWQEFITQAASFIRYGFSIHEIVLRHREKSKGSKFNDGLIGIKKLPIRSQDSILGFEWKNKGRDIAGVWQKVNIPTGRRKLAPYTDRYYLSLYGDLESGEVFLKNKKILHFKTGSIKDNPYGVSPLVACYKPWKYKQNLQDHELIGIGQDLRGMKVIYVHPKFLDPNASEEDKKVGEYYKRVVNSLHNGDQSGILLPSFFDENGNQMFKFDVVSVMGQKAHDVSEVIERYNTAILTALTADFLILGQKGSGSYALSENKMQISEIAIESKLREIKDVLNHKLIPLLFELNGWDTDVTPYFDHSPIKKDSLSDMASAIQRVGATGLVPMTPKVVNRICSIMGLPEEMDDSVDVYDMTEEQLDKFRSLLTRYESNAGEGMEEGLPNGTGQSDGSSGDSSVSNNANN